MSWVKKLFTKKGITERGTSKGRSLMSLAEHLLPEWKEAISLQDVDAEMARYLKILKDHPIVLSARNNLAVIYNQKGKYSEALDLLKEVEHPLLSDSAVTLGVTYYALDKLDEAIQVFEEAGSVMSAYSNLSFVLLRRGDYTAAIAAGEKAIEKDPSDPLAYGNLAAAYVKAGYKMKIAPLLEKVPKSVDIKSIKPGIQQNRSIHLVVFDPVSGALIMTDPRTNDIMMSIPS